MSSRIKQIAIEDMRKEGISPILIGFEKEILSDIASIEVSIKFDGRKLNGGKHGKR